MRTVGSRELKAKLSEVLREVREKEEVYVVTNRGRPIARIVPAPNARANQSVADVWSEMDEIAAEIARDWPEGTTAISAVAADRREI